MKKEKIILIGGGGHCKSVIDVIEQEGIFEIIGIIDSIKPLGEKVLGYEIIGSDDDIKSIFGSCKNAVIAIGHVRSNEARVKFFQILKEIGFNLPSIVSPLAYISKHSFIGEGSVIMHHALINANAKVGNNCIINTKALIEHDALIGDNCHISTGAIVNGGAIVEADTFYGSNSTSKEGVKVEGFIKAGSVVK